MELHQKFLDLANCDSLSLEIIKTSPILKDSLGSVLLKLIGEYYKKNQPNSFDEESLKVLRFLMCQKYNLNHKNIEETKNTLCTKHCDLKNLLECTKQCNQTEIRNVANDVMVLHLVLFEDQINLIQFFEEFRVHFNFHKVQAIDDVPVDWYLTVLKCFLHTWKILDYLCNVRKLGNAYKAHLESCKKVLLSSTMYDLQTWITCRKSKDWFALTALLVEVVDVSKSPKILSPYAHEILDEPFDLTIICTLCDFIFPLNAPNTDVDFNLICHDNLWSTIQEKLIFNSFQVRKEALYIFKRLNDFIDAHEENIRKVIQSNLVTNKLNPFVCFKSVPHRYEIKQIRTNFMLLMEALEEKQKHLVIPCLPLLDTLIDGSIEHRDCGNCFDFSWVYCVFDKILKHDNNSVVKWGILKSLRLHADSYILDALLILIINCLNNTYLYEKCYNDQYPEIVTTLTKWFDTCQCEELRLIEKVVYLLQTLQWGPVPIYNLLQSILNSCQKLDDCVGLVDYHLEAIGSVMESSVKMHPAKMRSMITSTAIELVSRFNATQNLLTISNLISTFNQKDLTEQSNWVALRLLLSTVHYNSALSFISQVCDDLKNDCKTVQVPMFNFSLLIQLLYEAGVICQTDQCMVKQELINLFLCLDKIDSRPYVNVSLVMTIIDLLFKLFDWEHEPPNFIYIFFVNYKDGIFNFILKLSTNEHFDELENVKICTRALQSVKFHVGRKVNTVTIVSNKKELEAKCMNLLDTYSQHSAIKILFAMQTIGNLSGCDKKSDQYFFMVVYNILQMCKSKTYSSQISGKLGLEFYDALSKLIKLHVAELEIDELKSNPSWLEILSSIVDAAGNKVLIHFGDIMRIYTSAVVNGGRVLEDFKFLIKSFWNCNFASKRDADFWLVNQKLTQNINSIEFLRCKPLQTISQEFIGEMLSQGESLPALKYILLTCSEITCNFNLFMDSVLNGLLHGDVMRRDQRIYLQTYNKNNEIENFCKIKNGSEFQIHSLLNRFHNVDATIRSAAALQLSKSLHTNSTNASLFLPLVLKKFLAVLNKRYHADSQLHKMKHRIMQIFLIMQPYLDKESIKVLYYVLCDSILQDSDQHSVRMMKEWLLMRIYLSNKEYLPNLWTFFDKVCDERPGNISSVIGIIWHVAKHLPKESLDSYIKIALQKLGVCCMGQQFSMRLFGQVFFSRLYELLGKNSEVRAEYANFLKVISESLRSGGLKKNPAKIDEDFFYTLFDPIQHYTLETIYHQLPRLSNVSFEEWVTVEHFNTQMLILNNSSVIDIPVKNPDNLLNQVVNPYPILKSSEYLRSEEILYSEPNSDVQKKMMPWKIMLPNEDDYAEIKELKAGSRSKHEMIIAASLIDKSQNLGGIVRTCEIFGIKEVTIANLKQMEDKEFQSLSVSADKWIKITEVKSFHLQKYLLNMKYCGWNLVGAEQTANSTSLFNYKFPKKTLLVLGNERNGIPANIIPLLDVCVELPQFGVIRSLNVHVTSAICIWEYVKQQTSIS